MYCTGAARRALRQGARLKVAYGFTGRFRPRSASSRRRFIARDAEGHALASRVEGLELDVPAQQESEPPPSAITVDMAPVDVSTGTTMTFRVSLRAGAETRPRVYLRDDLVRFRVRGPLGEVECGMNRQPIVPIVDFFQQLGGRRRASVSVDAVRYCPDQTFAAAGIYEVTPIVDLPYDADRYGLQAVTGSFEGPMVPVRVRRGALGYVEQVPIGSP
jgi:hypothetical protein